MLVTCFLFTGSLSENCIFALPLFYKALVTYLWVGVSEMEILVGEVMLTSLISTHSSSGSIVFCF